uniref:Vipericidin n=1 Tax=Naja naja TaxID=35670 RepID=A0A8C6XV83_NAJNA
FMAKEPTMEGIFWKTLLVVGALSASGHCAPSQKVLTYAEAVEQGVVNYNKKAKEDSLYRLLEAVPRPGWDPNSKGTQELIFTIKETVCPAKKEASLDKCDFKEGGVKVKEKKNQEEEEVRKWYGGRWNHWPSRRDPTSLEAPHLSHVLEKRLQVKMVSPKLSP